MAEGLLVASAAIKAANSKTGRKVTGVIAGVLLFFLTILIAVVVHIFSIFSWENISGTNGVIDVQATEIYRQIRIIYDEYVEDKKEEMTVMEEAYREANTEYRTETVYDAEKEEYVEEEVEYCTAEITQSYSHMNTATVMAYLSCKNQKDYIRDATRAKVRKEELREFWETVSGIKVDDYQTDAGQHIINIYNNVMGTEEIAKAFFASSFLQKQFLETVHIMSSMIGNEYFTTDIGNVNENSMPIPLYHQYDSRWGRKAYGDGNITVNGCGPTCIAMVFSYLKNTEILPSDIVDFTGNKYYVKGAGSSWSIFSACADRWGIRCSNIGTSYPKIIAELSVGKPVILSMGPGMFTSSGHFIVITGIDADGNVTVNDPNDNDRKNHINRKFYILQILREAKGGWSFEE